MLYSMLLKKAKTKTFTIVYGYGNIYRKIYFYIDLKINNYLRFTSNDVVFVF